MRLNDYTVPNKEFTVDVAIDFKSESLGAQTSATDSANQGIAPSVLNVNLLIAKTDPRLLSELTAIAKATQADGSQTVYNVTDETANAMSIRQVRFSDRFSVRQDPRLKAWQISFALTEVKSVAEKVEKRQEVAKPKAQAASGTTVAAPPVQAPTPTTETPPEKLTGFEAVLASVDKSLSTVL